MEKLTILIYSYNDDENIASCIASAKKLTTDVIVIDQKSTDHTQKLAKQSGASIVEVDHVSYVEQVRELGIALIRTGWVLILDSDERITEELAYEIKRSIQLNTHSHYEIPRKNIFGRNKWLRYGGWWPDYQTRLLNVKDFKRWPTSIHSTVVMKGTRGTITQPLLHFFHGNLEEMVNKTVKFEDIESDLLYRAHRSVSTATFFRKFFGELYRRLIKHTGFLDGKLGIIESIYQAFSKTVTYLLLYEKKTSRSL